MLGADTTGEPHPAAWCLGEAALPCPALLCPPLPFPPLPTSGNYLSIYFDSFLSRANLYIYYCFHSYYIFFFDSVLHACIPYVNIYVILSQNGRTGDVQIS